jgi:error-prone DNA polymerase
VQDIPAEDPVTYDMICQGRHRGRVPDRKPSPAGHAAAPAATLLLRPGHRGRHRAAGPDPGRHGSPVPEPPPRQGTGDLPERRAARGAWAHAGRARVPGTGHADLSILAAGFTPGEADGLRRAMAAWKRKGGLEKYYSKIVDGMTQRGYDLAFAQGIFEQIKGFPSTDSRSHAASFCSAGLRELLDQAPPSC